MRACLAICLLLLGVCSAFASPFDPVPAGDPAYGDCNLLAESGIIDARPPSDFTGTTPLTRYDFTLSLLRPIAALEALARDGRAGTALERVGDMPQTERAHVSAAVLRLLEEFADGLSDLGIDASTAAQGARLLENPNRSARAPATGLDNAAGVSFETARARVGVIYRQTEGAAAALPHVPLGGFADAPITGLAGSRLPIGRAQPDTTVPDRVASSDISLRRLRGSVEYGVTDSLTLNLAYEAMVREGSDAVILDAASLRTLGVGYRLSSTTSLALRYHLIDYATTAQGMRLQDRMAETELTVRF